MPVNSKTIDDYFATISRELQTLKNEVYKLKAAQLKTAPEYLLADGMGTAVDYQVAIDSSDDSFNWHSNGAWHKSGGGIWSDISSDITVARLSGGDTPPTISALAFLASIGQVRIVRLKVSIDTDAGSGTSMYLIAGAATDNFVGQSGMGRGICYQGGIGQPPYGVTVMDAGFSAQVFLLWDGATNHGVGMGPTTVQSPVNWAPGDTIFDGFFIGK